MNMLNSTNAIIKRAAVSLLCAVFVFGLLSITRAQHPAGGASSHPSLSSTAPSLRITHLSVDRYKNSILTFTVTLNTGAHAKVPIVASLSQVDTKGAQPTSLTPGGVDKRKSESIRAKAIKDSFRVKAKLRPGTYVLRIDAPGSIVNAASLRFQIDERGNLDPRAANTPVIDTFVDDESPDPTGDGPMASAKDTLTRTRRRHKHKGNSDSDPGPPIYLTSTAHPNPQFAVEVWLDDDLEDRESHDLSIVLYSRQGAAGSGTYTKIADISGETLIGTRETTLPSVHEFYYLTTDLMKPSSSNMPLPAGDYTLKITRTGPGYNVCLANFTVKQ